MLQNTNKLIFHATLALMIVVLLITFSRLAVWHSSGWIGIFFDVGVGEYVEENDTMSFEFTDPSTIGRVQPESPADRAGIKAGDQIITINGIPAFELDELRALNNDIAPGDTLTIELNRNDESLIVSSVLEPVLKNNQVLIQLITSFFVAIMFFALGFFLLYKKPGDNRVIIFHLMCITTGVVLLIGSIFNPELSHGIGIYASVKFITLIFAGIVIPGYYSIALLVHFTLLFPIQRPSIRLYPFITNWLYGLPSAVFGILIIIPLLVFVYSTFIEGYQIYTSYDVGYVLGRYFTVSLPLQGSGITTLGIAITISFIILITFITRVKKQKGNAGYLRMCLYKPHLCFILLYFFSIMITGLIILTLHFVKPDIDNFLINHIFTIIALGVPVLLFFVIFITSTIVYSVLVIINLILSYREGTVEGKRQIRWPLWGIGTAIVGSLVLSIPHILEEMDVVLFNRLIQNIFEFLRIGVYALIPVTIVIATIKYRLMDIDIIIKKTVIYTLMSIAIIAVYLILVVWIGGYIVTLLNIQTYWITVTSTIAIAIAFIPFRNYLQRIIDRRFHKKKTDYDTSLEQLRNIINKHTTVQTIENVFVEHMQTALQNRTIFIMHLSNETSSMPVSAKIGLPDDFSKIRTTSDDHDKLIKIQHPVSVINLFISDLLSTDLKRLRSEIAAPVRIKNKTTSIIWIGRKLSDFPFDDDDLHFIKRAAEEFSLAIQELQVQEREVDYSHASEIQKALLPQSIPDIQKCTIAASWHPARTVAGDYYDIIKLNDTRAAICIADVVGKGMPAALLMSNLQALVRAYASDEMPPEELCNKVNGTLSGNIPKGKFITFCIGIIDTASMKFNYSNAGHNRPVIVRSNGTLRTLEKAGPALGMMNNFNYSRKTESIESKDRIVFYTDGITEAMNQNRDEFGDERLMEILKEGTSIDVSELHNRIVSEVKSFSGTELRDDVTLIITEIQ